ncbi:MAG: hypothetical protein KDJ36_15065 [Hyphomicrobiaceae bacterium]|nr:hypothetical protein [Hyphomicrobiaceae bacterium]
MAAAVAAVLGSTPSAIAKELPDLVIAVADLKSTGQCDGRGPAISGSITVKNAGAGRGLIFTTRDMLRITVRGRPRLSAGFKFVNSMAPGHTQRVPVSLGAGSGPHKPGRLTVDITVDPRNVFEESNKRNNRMRMHVTMVCR